MGGVVEFTATQEKALDRISRWIGEESKQFCTEMILTGYAGTGKTTLLAEVKKLFPSKRIAFLTFTGKASVVLRKKLYELCEPELLDGDFIGTLHSFIYEPILRYNFNLKVDEIIGWRVKEEFELAADLIIIDEASMLSEEIISDLRNHFKYTPVLYSLDPFQLPPINQQFCRLLVDANSRQIPVLSLTEIHRQVADNPIIQLSMYLRTRDFQGIKVGKYSDKVFKFKYDGDFDKILNKFDFIDPSIACLTFTNNTRKDFNNRIRKFNKFLHPEPYPTEKVICLKNDRHLGIYNGEIGKVLYSMYESQDVLNSVIDFEDRITDLFIDMQSFGQVGLAGGSREKKNGKRLTCFDYGYVITTHKAQGSQWDKVIVFDIEQKFGSMLDYQRWLYTAITRSSDKLVLFGY